MGILIENDEPMIKAMEVAKLLAGGSGPAVSASKQGISSYLKQISVLVHSLGKALKELSMHFGDTKEALPAFPEKSEPDFKGRRLHSRTESVDTC